MVTVINQRRLTMTNVKRFLRRPEVLTKIGISKTSLYNLEKAGRFPQHILLGPRTAVWDEAAVEAWMNSRQDQVVVPAAAPDVALRRHAPGRGKSVEAQV